MEVRLLNAAHMKAVPQRKTDIKDAEWITQLLAPGLLRPSFVPPPDICPVADAAPDRDASTCCPSICVF